MPSESATQNKLEGEGLVPMVTFGTLGSFCFNAAHMHSSIFEFLPEMRTTSMNARKHSYQNGLRTDKSLPVSGMLGFIMDSFTGFNYFLLEHNY